MSDEGWETWVERIMRAMLHRAEDNLVGARTCGLESEQSGRDLLAGWEG